MESWELGVKLQKKRVMEVYTEEKRKVKGCIYQIKEEMNE